MIKDLVTLCIFFITGGLIGMLFDVFRISRKTFKTPNIITYIEDSLFWILSGILILYVIYVFTYGEIRLYMILMIIIGIIIYFGLISKYFIIINLKIINLIKKVLKILFNPFYKFIIFLKKIIKNNKK